MRAQTRKSQGGKAPRKTLHPASRIPQYFLDHTGKQYTVCQGTPTSCMKESVIRKLSIHLYCLGPLEPSPEAVGNALLHGHAISGTGNANNFWPRADVYAPLNSIEECIEHHRLEKAFRRQAVETMRQAAADAVYGEGEEIEDEKREAVRRLRGKEPLPHILPTWCCSARFWDASNFDDRYRSFILIVPDDCKSWSEIEQKGMWLVRFDQDLTLEMQVQMVDVEPFEGCIFDNPTEWVEIEKTCWGPPVSIRRVCIQRSLSGFGENVFDEETGRMIPKRWTTPGCQESFMDAWWSFTGALRPDCVYKPETCHRCYDEIPHEDCEQELSEHYFDEDGQCIDCRRESEYRRRSKRIANRVAQQP